MSEHEHIPSHSGPLPARRGEKQIPSINNSPGRSFSHDRELNSRLRHAAIHKQFRAGDVGGVR